MGDNCSFEFLLNLSLEDTWTDIMLLLNQHRNDSKASILNG